MNKRLFKKILSFMLAIMLILPPVSEVSMAVINAAENATINETVYEHDGYIVVYKVAAQWEGHKAIEVTLKNTGTKSITNWALSIDNTGDMTGLWNAVLSETDADKRTVKCMDYNNTIQAGQSVTFGYTLKGTDLSAPDDISMCAVESVLSEGFDVEYKVTGDWGTGFQGEIKIVNESEVAIEGWKLNFRGNFDVLNYWNCELTENADGTYTLSHTSWQNSISAGGEYVIGFVGSKTDDEMVISDVKMSVTGCGVGSGETETDPTSPSEPETSLVAPTEPETTTAAPTEPTTTAPEINWDDETDTDNDGLTDVYEVNMFGTNPEKADTDGDNLLDGYELLDLGTNPTKADSDNNGITDDKEDADNDGLDNLTEDQLGTNPTNADGDYDGLNDKEEIENYGTDPSDYDTDDDGIGDGDELKLGLDPLNSSTNGVPDGQYTITQTIGADSEVLCDVNSSTENPFELSLEVMAAGLADKSLTVNGSTENAMFQNESYVGELITIDYKDTMEFESIQINFTMDEAVLENELDLFGDETTELKGIRRFNVFKFVEEVNMLLPIETFHDDETNTVYAVTDSDGMYYLVDMEKWLYGLQQLNADEEAQVMSLSWDEGLSTEATLEDVETEVTTVQNVAGEGIAEELKEEMTALAEMIESGNMPVTMSYGYEWRSGSEMIQNNHPIDIVFVIQTDCIWSEPFREAASSYASCWMYFLEKKYTNMRASVLCRTKTENYFIGENYFTPQWYTNSDDVWRNIPRYEEYVVENNYLIREYFDILLDQEIMGYREDAAKFVADIQWGSNMMDYYYFSYCMEQMAEQGIVFCEIHEIQNAYSSHTNMVKKKIEMTGGTIFSYEESDHVFCVCDLVDEIMSSRVEPQTKFKAIVATGYEEITLDEPLSSEGVSDTDYDELLDWDEVNTELIQWNSDGSFTLPSLLYCIENYAEDSYVIKGLERFKQDILDNASGVPTSIYDQYIENILRGISILPIHSNPVAADSDADGIGDYEELDIGTKALVWDTDNDGLSDGFEAVRWFDPLTADGDFDEYNDLEEYLAGTDPYCYNKEWDDYVWDFSCGVVAGDFIKEPESIAVVMGQIFGGFFVVADVRDLVANLMYGDYLFAGLNAVGLTPLFGDIGKAAINVGEYIAKNINNLPEMCNLFSFVNRYCPQLAVEIGKTDAFANAVADISKADSIKLTKESAESVTKFIKAAEQYDELVTVRKIADITEVEVPKETWDLLPAPRGTTVDEFRNQDTLFGLGSNFPVADRLESKRLISTKTMDLGLPSYQEPSKLKRALNNYANKLMNFEEKYFKKKNYIEWGGRIVKEDDYNTKVLEVIFPDMMITDCVLSELEYFKEIMKSNGIIVEYFIGVPKQ